MEILLKGKRFIVNGAAGRLGRAIIKGILLSGGDVIAIENRISPHTKNNMKKLKEHYPKVEVALLDPYNWEETQERVKNFGLIDGLINNPGIIELTDFLQIDRPEIIERSWVINVKSLFCITQQVCRNIVEGKGKGVIVNMSSTVSRVAVLRHAVYGATKGAVDEITKVMVEELNEYGIRILSVNPTAVMTEVGKVVWYDRAKQGYMLAKVPMGRFASVSEAVPAIIYCLSDECSLVNGTLLPIDGAFSADSIE